MKKIILLSLVVLLYACKDDKKAIGDLSDIAPKSENYNGDNPEDSSKVEAISLAEVFLSEENLTKSLLDLAELRLTDTLLFLDRFQTTKKSTFLYTAENDSILCSKWNFRDSTKTKNAFLNWTNCFGTKCKSIRIGEKANLQKDGFLLMMNDTCVVYIGTNSRKEQNKWLEYYTLDKKSNWKYILSQMRNEKVLWQRFKDKKLTPIEENTFAF